MGKTNEENKKEEKEGLKSDPTSTTTKD